MSRTIDLTPTWETAAAIYLAVLDNQNASADGRDVARAEIMRLARAFDQTQTEPEPEPEPEPGVTWLKSEPDDPDIEPRWFRWRAERRWHAAADRDELDLY